MRSEKSKKFIKIHVSLQIRTLLSYRYCKRSTALHYESFFPLVLMFQGDHMLLTFDICSKETAPFNNVRCTYGRSMKYPLEDDASKGLGCAYEVQPCFLPT